MKLKPKKEKSEILYPTIKETSKSNITKKMFLATAINVTGQIYPVAVVCYVATPSYIRPISICKVIRIISIFIAVLSAIILFVNKMKIDKLIEKKETEEKIAKLKKKRKIKWWIFGISIAIIIITSIVIIYFKNQM